MTSDPRRDDWETPDGAPVDRPTHVIAHLSDTHLTSRGVAYNGVLDADAAMRRALRVLGAAAAQGRRVDAVVISGDLTDTGDPDAYRRLRDGFEGLAQEFGPPAPAVIYATGNHDVRTQFHQSLGIGQATAAGKDAAGGGAAGGPILQVHDVAGLRLVVLDSTIPGHGNGRLADGHIDELVAELTRRAPQGTVVVLHHPPLPPPSPLLSYFALERASCRALAGAIADTDVRLVLCGHHHLAQFGMLAGRPVAVAGSTAIRTDPLATPGHERTFDSGSFNLVELFADTLTISVIPLDNAPQVFDLDAAGCRQVIEAYPAAAPDHD